MFNHKVIFSNNTSTRPAGGWRVKSEASVASGFGGMSIRTGGSFRRKAAFSVGCRGNCVMRNK